MIGWYDDIELNFMISGHTKFVYDGYFENIKKLFYKTRINTVEDVEQVINISAVANVAVRYKKNWVKFDMILLHFFLHILKSFQD